MVKKVIITDLAEIRLAVAAVLEDVERRAKLTEEKIFHIKISLNELLSNSIKYSGSGSSVLIYSVQKNFLRCSILDNGRGFDPKEKGRCSDLSMESGRGIFIVESLAEELRYNKKGNGVYLRICLD